MSRGTRPSLTRCLVVWLLVSAVAGLAWRVLAATAAPLGRATHWRGTFDDLLVALAAAALLACAAWLWLVTTTTVVEVARGRVPTDSGWTRRLVLAACGVAVLAGVASPALAGDSDRQALAGLPLPDRAVSSAVRPAAVAEPPAVSRPAVRRTPPVPVARTHTVRPGDSLWSIAAAALGPGASPDEVDAAWRALYADNRQAIGADPDLIRPGLHLTTEHIEENR